MSCFGVSYLCEINIKLAHLHSNERNSVSGIAMRSFDYVKYVLYFLSSLSIGISASILSQRQIIAKYETTVPERRTSDSDAEPAFFQLPPFFVLPQNALSGENIRVEISLELTKDKKSDAENQSPRILDIITTYLTSLGVNDFKSPGGIYSLKSQLLKRLNFIFPDLGVSDILISKIIIN